MTHSASPTILISEPRASDTKPFLPYLWSVMKTHWEHDEGRGQCEWLEPLHEHAHPSVLLEPYKDTRIDILGLSCYTWNWEMQLVIAQAVLARNPDCLVI